MKDVDVLPPVEPTERADERAVDLKKGLPRATGIHRKTGHGFRSPKGLRQIHGAFRPSFKSKGKHKFKRAQQVIRDIVQVRADAEAYNATRPPGTDAIDPDPDGRLEAMAREATIRVNSERLRKRFRRPKI